MNTARIVVLAIVIGAGGIAAYLASGSGDKPPPAEPVAQLPTVDVLIAKGEINLGQTVKADDMQRQTWPTASASNSFIRRSDRPDAPNQLAPRSIADANAVETVDASQKFTQSVSTVRFGIPSGTTTTPTQP
jgi:Flp pilus assembly protein CpaB